MKKVILPLLALSLVGLFGLNAVAVHAASPKATTYTFTVMDTEGGKSNASGEVFLQGLPNGKTLVRIHAKGLQAGGQYFLTWSTATGCQLETDNTAKTFNHFTVKSNGSLNYTTRLETDPSAIGSIGIRTEAGQTLVACATATP
jgi:hypothetical protein